MNSSYQLKAYFRFKSYTLKLLDTITCLVYIQGVTEVISILCCCFNLKYRFLFDYSNDAPNHCTTLKNFGCALYSYVLHGSYI